MKCAICGWELEDTGDSICLSCLNDLQEYAEEEEED